MYLDPLRASDVDPHWLYAEPDPQSFINADPVPDSDLDPERSGSGTIKSPNWFQAIFYKSRKKSFQICAWTLKINYFFRFRLEKYNFLGKINEDPTDSHRC